jgi:hypothetical protein
MVKIEPLPITLTPYLDIPFMFDSYRDLVHDLGAMDGLAAAQTLASKHFIDDAAEDEDPQKFVLGLAVRYRVSTHFVDFPRVPSHLTQLLIVGTCQQAEAFLDKFRREQFDMGRKWRAREDHETQLKYTLDCINGGFGVNKIKVHNERYELFEYYRLVRNSFVHSSIDGERIKKEFDSVSGLREMVEEKFGLVAPNPVSDVTFDDHMLFTRITKYLATDLCRLAPPHTTEELLKFLLFQREEPTHPLVRILRRKTRQEHYLAAIRAFYRGRYNYDIRKNPHAWNGIAEWMEKLPNKHQRRDMGAGNLVDYARTFLNDTAADD